MSGIVECEECGKWASDEEWLENTQDVLGEEVPSCPECGSYHYQVVDEGTER